MKIAILGYARDGQAAYKHWNREGNELTICDQNQLTQIPERAASQLGPEYLKNLDRFDVLVRSAGLLPRLIVGANPNSPNILSKVTGNIDEFFSASPTKNIIGVTGTKGKGTTSTLIAKMLEASGKKVHLGGNIGIPALELLNDSIQSSDWVVLEQSSFQLIDQKSSPHIGVCLMVVSEHMDWHIDMNEYIRAKQQMFSHQNSSDVAIYYDQNEYSKQVADVSPGTKIPYFAAPGALVENGAISIDGKSICRTEELKLLGKHNWQNVCAAVTTVWQITKDINAIRSVLTSFSGLEHRLELVRELDGIKYYDDSFGTTPETAIVAIEALTEPKIVILGGSIKDSEYSSLAETIAKNKVRQVILIGNSINPHYKTAAPVIETALRNKGVENLTSLVKAGTTTMDEIVKSARAAAQPGDVVLFSTACASFDMFVDYKDRGEKFKKAVQALV